MAAAEEATKTTWQNLIQIGQQEIFKTTKKRPLEALWSMKP
jgi:hypothetical protein